MISRAATSATVSRGAPLLTVAEVAALLIIGYFFVRRQLALPVPLLPVDLLRIPLFSLSICTSICSFCAQMLALVSLPSSNLCDGQQE